MKRLPPSPEGFEEAAEILWSGGVIAYPTETVYGLAADPFNESAIEKLFEIKGRPENNPVLLIIDNETQLYDVIETVPPAAAALIEKFWPGPLSLLLPRNPDLPRAITAGSDRVCVRCPACDIARAFCRAWGGPLTSTSANRSGAEPARSLDELDLPGLACAIDGGSLTPSPPSTIYDPETRRVLRAGSIEIEAIMAVL
jgi:L-threonylcarbamoyladenylate synthase